MVLQKLVVYKMQTVNPIYDGTFWECSRMERGKKTLHLENLSHTSYNDETLHGYPLSKEEPKDI